MKSKAVSGESPRESSAPSLRTQYLLEKERIQHEFGGLEQMRLTLGLSQRKVCQLLLVDPSAWTRWLKSGAPPHIHQALRWLIELRRTNPAAAAIPGNLDHRMDILQSKTQTQLKEMESQLAALERAVTFATRAVPPSADPRFEHAIAELKNQLAGLAAARSPSRKSAPKKRKPAPLRKKKVVRALPKKKTPKKNAKKKNSARKRAKPASKRKKAANARARSARRPRT